MLIEVYVYDIIFRSDGYKISGSDDDKLCLGFAQNMQEEFEMLMLGELNFFSGL